MPVRPPLRLLRLANPLVKGILRSRSHGLLSGSLLVLEYEGRTSGRTFAIPLRYAEAKGYLVALAVEPSRKRWWRAFAEPRRAVVLLRGHRREVVGRLAEGPLRDGARSAYAARYPRSEAVLEDAALVVFERAG
ncbi:MAG TPA: hypothetical protein VF073_05910 [Gaiella sp.]